MGSRTGRAWPRWVPSGRTADVLLAVGVAVFMLSPANAEDVPDRLRDPWAITLLLLSAAALAWRRRYPVAALWAVVATVGGYALLGYGLGPNMFPFGIMLYSAAAQGRRWHGVAATLVYGAAMATIAATDTFDLIDLQPGQGSGYLELVEQLSDAVVFTLFLGLMMAAGEIVRGRRAYLAEVARFREQAALRRVEQERLRIARELHDVLAHSISLISLQAAVAVRLADRKPGEAREAMLAVRHVSKDALAELRATLDTLRDIDDDDAPRRPTPGLDRLEVLVDNATAAGLNVQVEVTGERRELPALVDVAAYRVVQEALTNVARHAGSPATVTVTLVFAPEELTVRVDDDGHGSADSGMRSGSGLIGLRERLASVGGDLDAGPRPTNGWRVCARLPVPPGDRTHHPAPAHVSGGPPRWPTVKTSALDHPQDPQTGGGAT